MTDKIDDKTKSLVQPIRLGSKLNSFHQQVAKGANAPTLSTPASVSSFADMTTVVIFPDCSGSMKGQKIQMCRDALNTFIDNCFIGATRVGVASFPEQVVVEPTALLHEVKRACSALSASGGTPMADPLDFVLHEWTTVTHGIVISDGAPDTPNEVLAIAQAYKAKGLKLDAVHIGDEDKNGETLMKQLAEITGGIYIKFTDIASFARNFKFLTPKHRLALTTSKNPLALLGAAEIKL